MAYCKRYTNVRHIHLKFINLPICMRNSHKKGPESNLHSLLIDMRPSLTNCNGGISKDSSCPSKSTTTFSPRRTVGPIIGNTRGHHVDYVFNTSARCDSPRIIYQVKYTLATVPGATVVNTTPLMSKKCSQKYSVAHEWHPKWCPE